MLIGDRQKVILEVFFGRQFCGYHESSNPKIAVIRSFRKYVLVNEAMKVPDYFWDWWNEIME